MGMTYQTLHSSFSSGALGALSMLEGDGGRRRKASGGSTRWAVGLVQSSKSGCCDAATMAAKARWACSQWGAAETGSSQFHYAARRAAMRRVDEEPD
jgi:hypothetical protein